MSQCTCLAVHSCTGNTKCSGECRKWGDLSPGGQMPCLPLVRSSKLKVNVVWLYSVEKAQREGEEARERVFVIFSSPRLLFGRDAAVSWGNLMTNTGSMICELVD